MDEKYLERALELAVESIEEGGGPFGAVIVRDGAIIAEASNRVTPDHDPTAHAEIVAIRKASEKLENHDLSGCTIYASCEPCPMCLSAIYWARMDAVFFGLTRDDAADAGFDDRMIYEELGKETGARQLKMVRIELPGAEGVFRKWTDKPDREAY